MLPFKWYSTLDMSGLPLNEINPSAVLQRLAPEGRVEYQRVVMTQRQVAQLAREARRVERDGDFLPKVEPAARGFEYPPPGAVGSVAGAWLVEKVC